MDIDCTTGTGYLINGHLAIKKKKLEISALRDRINSYRDPEHSIEMLPIKR